MAEELAVQQPAEQRAALEVRAQVNQIQYLMQNVLKQGEHFGVIPGTGKNAKPTLFQSGAEKIAYMFHLVPTYQVRKELLDGGHREYEVQCVLKSRETGQEVGGGMGLCSTMESKYRYRYVWRNNQKERVENPDIADVYNTVMKMAKKRAFVDAVKSTTAASDIFTQDVEDLPEWMLQAEQPQPPVQGGYYAPPQPVQQPAQPQVQVEEERDDTPLIDAYKRMGAAIEAYCEQQGWDAQTAKEGVKKRPEWKANCKTVAYIDSITAEFKARLMQPEEAEVVPDDYTPDLMPADIDF